MLAAHELSRAGLAASVALLVVLSACVSRGSSPIAPSTPAATPAPSPAVTSTALSVRVLTRASDAPIEGASVLQNANLVGKTNRDGMAQLQVPVGVEFQISVTAAGYVGFGDTGSVQGSEVWTFYLERTPN
jgi:hypothetical protein